MENQDLIKRETYLDKLRRLRDIHLIKVVSGVRRCGKSSLFELFRRELREEGVEEAQIQVVNFENLSDFALKDYKKLHDYLKSNLVPDKMNYIFLDELQLVDQFEKTIDSLHLLPNVDLYITGSNAYFLSRQWATLLSGRYMEIKMLPFSFNEYYEMSQKIKINKNKHELFQDYLRNGGFPQSVQIFSNGADLGIEYLSDIFNTIIVKDILAGTQIDNQSSFERVMRFAFDNVSNIVSPNSISKYLMNDGANISRKTVEKYLNAARDAFILYPVERFDLRGKELLQTMQKQYLVDLGLRNLLLPRGQEIDTGRSIENIVYLELLRRGNRVWIGKTKSGKEVDFVVKTTTNEVKYIQVTDSMVNSDTKERELSALRDCNDNYEKIVLTMDYGSNNYEGIKQINLVNWLMEV